MAFNLGTSISFHVVLFATAIIVLPPIVRGLHETSQEQVVIPDTTLANDNDIGGVPNPGMGSDPTRDAAQENDPTENDSHGWADRRSDDQQQAAEWERWWRPVMWYAQADQGKTQPGEDSTSLRLVRQ